MSTSSNWMDMECENKIERGIFVRRRVLICGGIFVIAALTVVALLSHYLTHCKCGQVSSDSSEDGLITTPDSTSPTITNLRLPTNLRPLHYQLRLQPFLDNFTFSGHVVIHIECLEDTDVITLHVNNLTIHNETVQLLSHADEIPQISSYDLDTDRQFIIFNLNDPLRASNFYNLSLQFNGILGDNLAGFYRSKYDNESWMATTQFEPTDARRAFPCFDEPGMKARFTVSLVRPKGYISISNMPCKANNTKTNDNWEIDEYLTTPNMSTYLLAFVVTKFSHTYQKSNGGVEFRVYSRHSAKEQTKFAVETGPMVLDFFDDFFNIPYPLPKQDMIAIPDFASGAMENWGLITFRETELLFDSKLSSVQNKERIASVIAHELAHQWFGNLVSPAWWDDLWLNEGFASYMEVVAVDHQFKKWKMLERFLATVQWVLEEDSLKTSHPISVPVENPDQINEIFDTISYGKGAAIIRMMVNFIGNDAFREGLKTYFEEKKYKNAVQDDLWRHMTQAAKRTHSSIDVKKIMDTWTVQTGYPVVTVSRDNYEQTAIVTQRIFHLIPEEDENNTSSIKWEIPLTFTSQDNPNFENTLPQKWMHNSTTEKSVTFTWNDGVPPADKWIIFNVQQTGYYRVNYQNDNWVMLTRQLRNDHTVIHVLNRAQLIDDAFNLAKAGELDYEIALNLSRYLVRETELVPWEAATKNFGYIFAMLSRTDSYGMWMNYVSKLIKPQYKAIGFQHYPNNDDNLINLQKQSLFVTQACHINLEDCIATSISLFNNWIANISTISPNLRNIVLCKAVQKGNIKEWNSIWYKYLNSNVGAEKSSFLRALTCTQEPWILSKMLNMIMVPEGLIRFQDAPTIASGIGVNKMGHFILFNFVRNKIKELHTVFSGSRLFSNIVSAAMYNLNTPFELSQLKEFVTTHSTLLASTERTMSQIIEETEANVSWINRNYKKIKKWLENEVKKYK